VDERVTLLAALAAGALSFISPFVLPFVPTYLSCVSGAPDGALRAARARVLVASLAFVAGFSVVFVALGASATLLGQLLADRLSWLGRLAGAVIVLFGLHTAGVLRIGNETGVGFSRASTETNPGFISARLRPRRPAGPVGAGLVGMAFAFGWTPCIGPVLAGVLALAGALETAGAGARLHGAYAAGLALPFLATSLFIEPYVAAFAAIRAHYRAIEIVSGVLLMAIGALVITNRFAIVAGWLTF
jgi:cytochrome c-type biogenesis protein